MVVVSINYLLVSLNSLNAYVDPKTLYNWVLLFVNISILFDILTKGCSIVFAVDIKELPRFCWSFGLDCEFSLEFNNLFQKSSPSNMRLLRIEI